MNNGDIVDEVPVFVPRRDKHRRFIPNLIYAMVNPIIDRNLVTLATVSPWSDLVFTLTCFPFLRKPLLS